TLGLGEVVYKPLRANANAWLIICCSKIEKDIAVFQQYISGCLKSFCPLRWVGNPPYGVS
ncbi:MAG: hypothetical protein J5680_03195, partial [Neisseriaceae bacterium]|nr:hypothetical protein [Neisseriaceae bacterium]